MSMKHKDIVATNVPTVGIELSSGPEGVIAVYFRITENPVARTIELDTPDVLVDVDPHGKLVGIELINPQKVNLKKLLKQVALKYKAKHLEQLSKEHSERFKKLQELIAV